jgi:CheY-like chemotaxis protein
MTADPYRVLIVLLDRYPDTSYVAVLKTLLPDELNRPVEIHAALDREEALNRLQTTAFDVVAVCSRWLSDDCGWLIDRIRAGEVQVGKESTRKDVPLITLSNDSESLGAVDLHLEFLHGRPPIVLLLQGILQFVPVDSQAFAGRRGTQVFRVLVVDDDPENILIYATRLEVGLAQLASHWVEVIGVLDGRSALDILQEHAVDLVITDLLLPYIDGYELVSRIRNPFLYETPATLSDVPIITVSARATGPPDATAHMVKPVSLLNLTERVAQLLISK